MMIIDPITNLVEIVPLLTGMLKKLQPQWKIIGWLIILIRYDVLWIRVVNLKRNFLLCSRVTGLHIPLFLHAIRKGIC